MSDRESAAEREADHVSLARAPVAYNRRRRVSSPDFEAVNSKLSMINRQHV